MRLLWLRLLIAVTRVAESDAQLGVTRSAQFPQVDGQASYANQRFSQNSFPLNALPSNLGVNPEQEFHPTGLDLSFELDLWRRLRRATEAARADLLAREENRRAVVQIYKVLRGGWVTQPSARATGKGIQS